MLLPVRLPMVIAAETMGMTKAYTPLGRNSIAQATKTCVKINFAFIKVGNINRNFRLDGQYR